jgi:ATP-dependent HslUV protease ATP-binding subunit HslU
MRRDLSELTPKETVAELDKFIIGQEKAKKAVAIALRNRLRRQRLPEELRDEVAPKNIIMIGPTGVGKTEIARRLSKLTGAPFVKVEATKYTEVGYVGRDVESMVRDLVSFSVSMVKDELQEGVREEAEKRTEEQILDLLLPGVGKKSPRSGGAAAQTTGDPASLTAGVLPPSLSDAAGSDSSDSEAAAESGENTTREKFRQRLREGKLDDKEVEIQITKSQFPAIEIFSGSNFEEMDLNLGNLSGILGGKKKRKRTTVRNARQAIMQEEMDKLVDQERVNEMARERAEQMGIIFIDEIDKIASKENRGGVDVSREGVQRDILPIVEGSQVNTKFGMVDTSHILFIAAGAFHMSKPSDLIPELQGRFPIRVSLDALGADDFTKILTQPQNSLIRQYTELLATEGVTLEFSDDAIETLSKIAAEVNGKTENIGARRLHTIMELLLEEVSFTAPELSGQTIPITADYVNERLRDVVEDQDLSRYIL